MKKILLLIVAVSVVFMSSLTINANTFNQSTNQVNYANEDYNALKSPYHDMVTYNWVRYQKSGPYLIFDENGSNNWLTPQNMNFQYNYGVVMTDFENKLRDYEYSEVYISDKYVPNPSGYKVLYRDKIDYTFNVPALVIVKVNNGGWGQVNSLPVGKISLYIEAGITNTNFFDYNYYLVAYDVFGAFMSSSGGFGGQGDMFIGLAYLDSNQINYNRGLEDGKSTGYAQGKYDGQIEGQKTGFDEGYIEARGLYGRFLDNEWLTANQYGTIRYDEGKLSESNFNLDLLRLITQGMASMWAFMITIISIPIAGIKLYEVIALFLLIIIAVAGIRIIFR